MPKQKDPVQVLKRDGSCVLFNKQKITIAICKAMSVVDELNMGTAERITDKVMKRVAKLQQEIPSVERIQDVVEEELIRSGLVKTAKQYILYRQQRSELREARIAVLHGKYDDIDLSLNALTTLEQRYLHRDSAGTITETPTELFCRVAAHIASIDEVYDGDVEASTKTFEKLLMQKLFLPNSPTLMHAGLDKGHLLAQHVIPIKDSVTSLFSAIHDACVVQQAGGGTGFDFSPLRPKNALVDSYGFVAMGPIQAMKIAEQSIGSIVQGGKRPGANMAILRVDHPDISEFINLKSAGESMTNFNLSVGITDEFMQAVQRKTTYPIRDPVTGTVLGHAEARVVFDTILGMAWRRGDPGLLFLDRIEKDNPTPELGKLRATSPCAEIALLDYESCAQGSINLVAMVDDDGIFNWDRLKTTIHSAVHFLDNMIDATPYPLDAIREATKKTRKLALGIMGFADLLYAMEIPYASKESLIWAEKIMKFIKEEAARASRLLAEKRGVFPAWKQSVFAQQTPQAPMRNAALLACSPTGTRSMIFDVSAGIEPNFALCYTRRALGGKEFMYVNPVFEKYLKSHDLYSETLLRSIAFKGSLEGVDLPEQARTIFVTTQQIPAASHIAIQATFQKYVDGAISKTINAPANASVADVEEGFIQAYREGCKGVTIYRDGSLSNQVIQMQF